MNEIRQLREIASTSDASSNTPARSDGEDESSDSEDANVDYTLGIYQSIGYKEFHDYLSSPTHSEAEFQQALNSMKSATRQYAKRQIMWIRNKLLPAVNTANMASRADDRSDIIPAYLLDATELGPSWDANVRDTAAEITEDFLAEATLPDPLTLSACAREVLSNIGKPAHAASSDSRRKVVCPVCTVNEERPVMIGEGREWDVHIRTRIHRRLLRKANRPDARSTPQKKAEHQESEGSQDDTYDTNVLFSE